MKLLTKTILIALSFGLSYGQDSVYINPLDIDTVSYGFREDNSVTESELLFALELADYYLMEYDKQYFNLIYTEPAARLREMANEIEKKEKDLVFIKSIRVRLALYGVKEKK